MIESNRGCDFGYKPLIFKDLRFKQSSISDSGNDLQVCTIFCAKACSKVVQKETNKREIILE